MPRQNWMELLSSQIADGTAVANTTSETVIYPGVTIPANYLQDGRSLEVRHRGKFSTTATPTIRFRARLGGVGGTLIWDSGTVTTATVTNAIYAVDLLIKTRSNGASGTVLAFGQARVGGTTQPSVGSATGAPAVLDGSAAGLAAPATAAVDLTANQDFVITATWSAASASNTLTGMLQDLFSLN
jgi:hypothetical protein